MPIPSDHTKPPCSKPVERAGHAVILGAPNAGKSTLINRLAGSKVAIVTHKVQTTRFVTRAIIHHDQAQIVLLDTPGIFSAAKPFERMMVKAAWHAAEDADSIIHLIDASARLAGAGAQNRQTRFHTPENDHLVATWLKQTNRKAIAALNKIDLFAHEQVLPMIADLDKTGLYQHITMLSARNGDGIAPLAALLARSMPRQSALYEPDSVTDLPLLAAEITREKLLLRLHQELPYKLKVDTENWEMCANGAIRIRQVVTTSNPRHKGMILGNRGQTIKAAGQAARTELAAILKRPVHLFLHVRAEPGWMDTQKAAAPAGG